MSLPKEDQDEIRKFITSDAYARQLVEHARKLAEKIARSVSTSQIRNAYGSMKKIEMIGLTPTTYRQLLLLKPRLAYAVGRAEKKNQRDYLLLADSLGCGINAVKPEDPEAFNRFCQFFEAILAYHKGYEKGAMTNG